MIISIVTITIAVIALWIMLSNDRTYRARVSSLAQCRPGAGDFRDRMSYHDSQSYNETLWRCMTLRKPYKEDYEAWAKRKESK